MPSTDLTFADAAAHRQWLDDQARLPQGFQVGRTQIQFTVVETGQIAQMDISALVLDKPSSACAAVFTRNAFPGAPVIIGRERLQQPQWRACLINNKISNVCAADGVATAEALCASLAAELEASAEEILPSSTGVIGWQLPQADMQAAMPALVQSLQRDSILPLAEGIMTTDLYPKVRAVDLPGGGRIVGVAKGAGMIEPNLATMLSYICTDVRIDRDVLRGLLAEITEVSYNAISIDSDQSTSDTVAVLSSSLVDGVDTDVFAEALRTVCKDLAEDLVRNGEGVKHVVDVTVQGAHDAVLARAVGKAVINSPLVQCAICGNDPNVGRLIMAIGKYLGDQGISIDAQKVKLHIGGHCVFKDGCFCITPELEEQLSAYLQHAEMYQTAAPDANGVYKPPVNWPTHERSVMISIDLGMGAGEARVVGCDRTHEYISENADYRS